MSFSVRLSKHNPTLNIVFVQFAHEGNMVIFISSPSDRLSCRIGTTTDSEDKPFRDVGLHHVIRIRFASKKDNITAYLEILLLPYPPSIVRTVIRFVLEHRMPLRRL